MSSPLRLGISTCPNDTFTFHALLTQAVDRRGLQLEIELADIEELNGRLLAAELDVVKASFAAALAADDGWGVLPVGSALGFGNGPLLLAGPAAEAAAPSAHSRVLCPGEHTTATLLYRLFHRCAAEPEQVLFSRILPELAAGRAEFGVCIHEGRFTYEGHGLKKVEDLGERWERETGAPLPLGGLLARKELDPQLLRRLSASIADSLGHALAHPEEALSTMRRYAQEASDEVLAAHVELYENAFTRDLGVSGRRALALLARRAAEAGLVPEGAAPLDVVGARRLFHVVPAPAWRAFAGEVWESDSLSREGFLHLSYADQLADTLAAHFPGDGEVILLEVDPELLGDALVLEPSRGGALFPHLYGPLPRAAILREVPGTESHTV